MINIVRTLEYKINDKIVYPGMKNIVLFFCMSPLLLPSYLYAQTETPVVEKTENSEETPQDIP